MATKNFRKAKCLFEELCLTPELDTADKIDAALNEKYPVNGPRVTKNAPKILGAELNQFAPVKAGAQ